MPKITLSKEHSVQASRARRNQFAGVIASAVRALLEVEGWSIPELGYLVGISSSSARNLARGLCNPSSDTARRLFLALGQPELTTMASQEKTPPSSLDLTNSPGLEALRRAYREQTVDRITSVRPALKRSLLVPLLLVLGGKKQWIASGLTREVTHVSLPDVSNADGSASTIDFGCPNPDTGGNIAVGQMLYVNQHEIPGGNLESRLQRGDIVLMLCPDGIRRTRAWLRGSLVLNLSTREITDSEAIGYHIEGRVLSHAPVEQRADVVPWGGLSEPDVFGDEHQSNERAMRNAAP